MEKKFYLKFKENRDVISYIKEIISPLSLLKVKDDLFLMSVDYFEDYKEIIKNFESEFFIDIAVYEVEVEFDDALNDTLLSLFKENNTGYYRFSDLLEKAIFSGNHNITDIFKKYFLQHIPESVIETGLVFIEEGNAVSASKELYIHRNTLNYRIETIKRETSLDIKKFKDSLVFYGLFH